MKPGVLLLSLLMLGMNICSAQCTLLESSELSKIRKLSFLQKKGFIQQRQGKLLTTKPGMEINCPIYTFGLCQEFLNDKQWYWSEIITYRQCQKVVTYSTSDESHFKKILSQLLTGFTATGSRSYGGLDYSMYENPSGKLIEVNHHANDAGITFWMVNLF